MTLHTNSDDSIQEHGISLLIFYLNRFKSFQETCIHNIGI
jgi:hypothetical protein